MIKDSWGAKSMRPEATYRTCTGDTRGRTLACLGASARNDARTRLGVVNFSSKADHYLQARVFRRE